MANGKDKKEKVDDTIYQNAEREALERPWATNDKLTYDCVLSHIKSLMNTSEQIINNNIAFTEQVRNDYLTGLQHARENNRKTLSFLYDVEIPEGVANAIIVEAAKKILALQNTE